MKHGHFISKCTIYSSTQASVNGCLSCFQSFPDTYQFAEYIQVQFPEVSWLGVRDNERIYLLIILIVVKYT